MAVTPTPTRLQPCSASRPMLMCSDNADGLCQAAEPCAALRGDGRGHRHMAARRRSVFCGDSFGEYGPAADGAWCGRERLRARGAQEMSCRVCYRQNCQCPKSVGREVGGVAKYGELGSALVERGQPANPRRGGHVHLTVRLQTQLSSDSGGEAFLMPIARSCIWRRVVTPLVRKQQQEHVFEVPASSSTEHTFCLGRRPRPAQIP